ncbi:MAG: hypothetical protein ACI3XA_08055 [Clostridia bacterium]
MKKKFALLTSVFVLIGSMTAFAQGFSDMPQKEHPDYPAVEYAINNKIITGTDGKLALDSPVTLAETLTFISRVKPFGSENADLTKVTDISQSDWYYETFSQAVASGFITPDENSCLNPKKVLSVEEAMGYISRALGTDLTKVTTVEGGEKTATRQNVVTYIYNYASESSTTPTESATEPYTEGATESATEFTDLKAKAAQEAMQLALGILPDGTSYTKVTAYQDRNSTDWATGKVSSSTSRPSGGGGNNNNKDDEDNEEPTEAPTEEPTEAPTYEPTEPPTSEPTEPDYGDYDGPIDNDKDNVIDDPFDDGWRPDGGNSGGEGGGYDGEDEDFIVDDGDDPAYAPTDKETDSTEEETQAPTDSETDSTEEETEAPTDSETDSTEEGTQYPTDSETDSTDEEPQAPSDSETDVTDEETTLPKEDDEASSDDGSGEKGDSETEAGTALSLSKDWWL